MIILRYLSREVFHSMLVLMIILLLIMVSNTFIRYLSQAAAGSINSSAVINLISFTVPNFIVSLLPITLFLSVVITFGKLFADNELLVMFACGLTWRQLLKTTLLIAVFVALLVAVLSFWLVPKMLSHRDSLKAAAQSKNTVGSIQAGRFIPINNKQDVVYIGSADADNKKMKSLFMYQAATNDEPPKITLAPVGEQTISQLAKRPAVALQRGSQYEMKATQKDLQIVHFKRYILPVNVRTIDQVNQRVTSMSTTELLKDASRPAISELIWRFSQPVTVFVVTILGVALCRVRPRKGRYSKLLPAVLIFIIYFNLLAASRSWATLGVIPAYISVWWVHLIFFILSMGYIWHLDGRRWLRSEVSV